MEIAWVSWLPGGIAFLSMLIFTPAVIRLARAKNWVAQPKADRWHRQPTALMGGLAIFASAMLGLAFTSEILDYWTLWAAGGLMFLTGLIDDFKDINPAGKLIAQILATIIILSSGYGFAPDWPFWVSIPTTFLWVIGITNAANLLDNMDGLAAGIAAIAAGMLAFFAALNGAPALVSQAIVIAGVAAGFLVFNFNPARIFMGDSGSLFLGFMIAVLAIGIQRQTQVEGGMIVYLASIAVLAIPIFDTTLVTLSRFVSGRSIAQGGRDHTSHRLVYLGLSEKRAVLLLYGISVLFGGLIIASHFADEALFVVIVVFMSVALVVFGIYLGRIDIYGTHNGASSARMPARILRSLLHHGGRVALSLMGDLLLVIASFVMAYYLRFERGLTPPDQKFLEAALPLIVLLKIPIFYLFGLYSSLWIYASTLELVRIVKATTVSAVVIYAALALLYGPSNVARGVIAIDWLIVNVAISTLRFGFRGLHQYTSAMRRRGRRVLIFGVNETAVAALRELRHNPRWNMVPCGFIDNDTGVQGMTVQGLRVFGPVSDIEQICEDRHIEEVIAVPHDNNVEELAELAENCRRAKMPCRRFTLEFSPAL